MLEVKEWTVEENIESEKATAYIGRVLSLSEKEVHFVVKYHLCGINKAMLTEESTVKQGDHISCTIPDERPEKDIPFDYPLDVLYEDDQILVINKPKGMSVIPGPGNWNENIFLALLNYYGKDSYYRLAHRIDKCTSGCLLVTKTKRATRLIAKQLQDRTCHREYRVLVKGNIAESGKIELPIGRDPDNFRRMGITEEGKSALTLYEPLEQLKQATELKVNIMTGRTHQIRVHLSAIGHPLIGDDVYGEDFELLETDGALLHAYRIHFIHPHTKEEMVIEAPLPEIYRKTKELLK